MQLDMERTWEEWTTTLITLSNYEYITSYHTVLFLAYSLL
jgi:hypothetical protein